MDLTSLLNTSTGINPDRERESLEHTPTPSIDISTVPSTALPTPSPEKSPARRLSDGRAPPNKNRTPWDAGGYSLPLSLDTKLSPTHSRPSYYSESPLDNPTSAISALSTASIYHSRSNSLDSSPVDLVASTAISPMTNSQLSRPTFLGEPEPHLEIATDRRPSVASDGDALLTARRPSFLNNEAATSASGSPKSPKHKFSDSHSSLSSYASSSQSGGHSRISSMSTVSGIQPLSSLLSDISPIEEKAEGKSSASPPHHAARPPSPSPQRNEAPRPRLPSLSVISLERSRSPSDAFLINRGSSRTSPSDNANLHNQTPTHGSANFPYLHPSPLGPAIPSLPSISSISRNSLHPPQPTQRHKRAISAPNFAGFVPPVFTAPIYHPQPQPFSRPHLFGMSTPNDNNAAPAEQHAQQDSSATATGSGRGGRNQNLDIPCEYMENCDTNTDRRKLISHIFGRNKLCTRQIPERVWVHYCRKHYQRCRYRNQEQYAMEQAKKVVQQIERIRDWSDANRNSGREGDGVIIDWTLAPRKREQRRRERSGNDEEEDDANGAAVPVPDWLAAHLGTGKSTAEIHALMERLSEELSQATHPAMPDFEILPNIQTDSSRRPQRSRRPSARGPSAAHRRTQSMGVFAPGGSAAGSALGLHSNSTGGPVAPSGPMSYEYHPGDKRKRDDDNADVGVNHSRRQQLHEQFRAIPEEGTYPSTASYPPPAQRSHSRSRSEMAPMGGHHHSALGYGTAPPTHQHGHQMGPLPFRSSRVGPPTSFTPSAPISMTRSVSYQQAPPHTRHESADFSPSYRATVSTYPSAPSFGRPTQSAMGVAPESAHRASGPYDAQEAPVEVVRRHSVYEGHHY